MPDEHEGKLERPLRHAPHTLVALLMAAFALCAGFYAALAAGEVTAFNAGSWLAGDELSMRGWLGYALFAALHFGAAYALWLQWRGAKWLAVLLLGWGLLPAVPAISAAVVDLRPAGIALWGALIIARTAALYALLGTD